MDWNDYESRMAVQGYTRRDVADKRTHRTISYRLPENLSFQSVLIDGTSQDVAIINSDNLDEKKIISLPGEDITLGSLVGWMDEHWLVIERDANTTVYTKAKMQQCNHLLKWVGDDNQVHEQWCIVEDGTKYLTGIYGDRNFITERGDTRITITIAKNGLTTKFNRESRFLVDDPDAEHKIAYLLTKPLRTGHLYNGVGIFKFVLQEVPSTDDDNHALGVADYYKHFSKADDGITADNTRDYMDEKENNTRKKVWL